MPNVTARPNHNEYIIKPHNWGFLDKNTSRNIQTKILCDSAKDSRWELLNFINYSRNAFNLYQAWLKFIRVFRERSLIKYIASERTFNFLLFLISCTRNLNYIITLSY